MRVFVDTGAFVASDMRRDQFHQNSLQTWKELLDQNARLISSDAVFQETMRFLHVRGGVELAIRWGDMQLRSKSIMWLPTDLQVRKAALPFMRKFADQGVSFVDATSFVLMRREGVRSVFGFDRHFTAAGFRLLSQ